MRMLHRLLCRSLCDICWFSANIYTPFVRFGSKTISIKVGAKVKYFMVLCMPNRHRCHCRRVTDKMYNFPNGEMIRLKRQTVIIFKSKAFISKRKKNVQMKTNRKAVVSFREIERVHVDFLEQFDSKVNRYFLWQILIVRFYMSHRIVCRLSFYVMINCAWNHYYYYYCNNLENNKK